MKPKILKVEGKFSIGFEAGKGITLCINNDEITIF
jgi:hypothetical protein